MGRNGSGRALYMSALEGPSSELAAFLQREQDEILACWLAKARQMPGAGNLSEPALVDHIPALLEELALSLAAGEALPSHDAAEEHGLARLKEGFSLGQVVSELSTLRDCVARLFLKRHPRVESFDALQNLS